VTGLMFGLAIKGTFVIGLTGLVAALCRGRSAATRHLVWTCGLASLAALPALAAVVPRIALPILAPVAPATAGPARAGGLDWTTWAARAWMAGAIVGLAGLVVGRLRVAWLSRTAEAPGRGTLVALATLACGRLDVSRPVTVLTSRRTSLPMTWGVLRPVVMLPADAERWPEALQRDVLLHELAHVKRHDSATQVMARLAGAIHWFNPLVWLAARRFRLERERACDDHVLAAGARPCDYATHLLAIAREVRPADWTALAVGLARRSDLAERLTALLDGSRRRAVVSRRLTLAAAAGAAFVVVPLVALAPVEPEPAPSVAWVLTPDAQVVAPPPSANAGVAEHARRATPRAATPEAAPRRPRPHSRDAATKKTAGRALARPSSTKGRPASTTPSPGAVESHGSSIGIVDAVDAVSLRRTAPVTVVRRSDSKSSSCSESGVEGRGGSPSGIPVRSTQYRIASTDRTDATP